MVASDIKGTARRKVPPKSLNLTLDFLKERKAVIKINNFNIEKRITKGCPQGSCCSPGLWNIPYNPILNLRYTKHTKIIALQMTWY